MISAESSGSFKNTYAFFDFVKSRQVFNNLDRYGRMGVDALERSTPRESGETARSWGYQIGHTKDVHSVSWFNTHVEDGVNIAVIIQYGHGTGTGGYVQGIDYINPAIRPIFEKMVDDIWRQVING